MKFIQNSTQTIFVSITFCFIARILRRWNRRKLASRERECKEKESNSKIEMIRDACEHFAFLSMNDWKTRGTEIGQG